MNEQVGLRMMYFVLKPGAKGAHGKASRAALRAYANAIRHENVILSEDLRTWADQEQLKSHENEEAI